jgi:hypothetical protein
VSRSRYRNTTEGLADGGVNAKAHRIRRPDSAARAACATGVVASDVRIVS